MQGSCNHYVFKAFKGDEIIGVGLANDADFKILQVFESVEEIDALIDELKRVRDIVFNTK